MIRFLLKNGLKRRMTNLDLDLRHISWEVGDEDLVGSVGDSYSV